MTARFHEGQEVEVYKQGNWRKAKIVNAECVYNDPSYYYIDFPDGSHGPYNVEHIRADTTLRVSSNDPIGTRPMTNDEARAFKAALAEAHDEALQAEGKP